MKISLDIELEKAVRILAKYLLPSKENSRKPILMHDLRVGMHLYENNYSHDIILAGVLHDALEFSEITEQMISEEFGENVLRLVKANSKDRSIENSDERIEELIKRCAQTGEDALIVKVADTLDSFKYYTKTNNQSELEYCRKTTGAIFKYKSEDYKDPIFEKLEEWINKL
ncbi:MAG TPA: HD domain-containing protein [Candidatus Moranbacteria bacterium]|nr:HD domain-containing protein [Candidatus Moranbacteria bacterium]